MADRPRLLVLIGSGELAPPMAHVQREIVRRMRAAIADARGPADATLRAAIIDTTYGFQANADAISAQLLDFHVRRLGVAAQIASIRRADGDALERERAISLIRDADLVFSGPGSPTYALRHWSQTEIPASLRRKLVSGGAIVFASAAALTLGNVTLPVYEIYKVGEDPRWLPGLDVLSAIGLRAAVVPHWNNAEGGRHDTRYCFIGEKRLRALEEQLPADTPILGIDEHTALVIDAGDATARVEGRGNVTLRVNGREVVHSTGSRLGLQDVGAPIEPTEPQSDGPLTSPAAGPAPSDDLAGLVRALLTIDDPAALRAHIVALGERVQRAEDERERLLEPLIALLLDVRHAARGRHDYARADEIRERLRQLGIHLADEPGGPTEFKVR
jgi:cyanophycinase-like exopeptidase